jgi:N-formylglutamate deformylase
MRRSAARRARQRCAACCATHSSARWSNGRFKGGYITRHYGRPDQHIHAIQLEMCQSLYMQEVAPFAYDEARAALVQPLLMKMASSPLEICVRRYES